MGAEPKAKAPSGPAGPPPPPKRSPSVQEVPSGPRERHPRVGALTGLQGGQRFRLLTELTVPDVIGRLHSELVGCEGLEPVGELGSVNGGSLTALPRHLCLGKWQGCRSIAQMGTLRLKRRSVTWDKQGPGPELPGWSLDHASLGCGHTFSSIISHRSPGGMVTRGDGPQEGPSAYFLPRRRNTATPPPGTATPFPNSVTLGRAAALKS